MGKMANENSDIYIQNLDKTMEKEDELSPDPILCLHCKRTNSNGIGCIGKCVAENNY